MLVTFSLKIIDSSTMPHNLIRCKSYISEGQGCFKLHFRLVFVDQDTVYPDKAVVINAVEHSRQKLKILVKDKDAMYVISRGMKLNKHYLYIENTLTDF
ncbi:hypothetical protein [Alkalihalobacillus deserti]|uniref:hypothetical protein n=1 Tax=Alkalihalobacillus deserti TaxID=2879466 RepID=UPI001D13666B|nr:hypothetical protein [Alkalihalobacillus deserti]